MSSQKKGKNNWENDFFQNELCRKNPQWNITCLFSFVGILRNTLAIIMRITEAHQRKKYTKKKIIDVECSFEMNSQGKKKNTRIIWTFLCSPLVASKQTVKCKNFCFSCDPNIDLKILRTNLNFLYLLWHFVGLIF